MMTPTEALTLLTSLMPTQRESEAHRVLRDFIAANTPWSPPQQEGYGPWIEYREGDPGPRVNEKVEQLVQHERELKSWEPNSSIAHYLPWREDVVAYCVKQDKP